MVPEDRIRETSQERLPRFLAAGVDYNDVQEILLTDLVVFPEENHVCDNIPHKYRRLMADWAGRRLA